MSSPCHGCRNRRENCHSMCQRYREYKTEIDIRRGTLQARSVGQIDILTINRRLKTASERQRRKRAEGWFAE